MAETHMLLAYAAVHALGAVLTGTLGYWFLMRTTMQAKRLFGLLFFVFAGWSTLAAVMLFVPNQTTILWVMTVTVLFAGMGSLVFVAAVSEYTGRPWRTNRVVHLFAVGYAVFVPVILTAPFHELYWQSPTVLTSPFMHVAAEEGPFELAYGLYGLASAVVGTYYFLELSFRSRHRQSTAVLVIAVGVMLFGFVVMLQMLNRTPVETYNHAAIGMIPFSLAFGYAATRFDWGIVAPVARDKAIEELSDLFFIVDTEHRLVDFNPAAARFFEGFADHRIGTSLETVAPELTAQLEAQTDDEQLIEVALEEAGQTYYFDLRQSAMYDPRGNEQGRQILLRDITKRTEQDAVIKAREAELEMLKQVFSRVFRHNVRNELTVAKGYTGVIAETTDDSTVRNSATKVAESTDRLLSHTAKAREIERVVDTEPILEPYRIPDLLERVLTHRVDVPADVTTNRSVDDVAVQCIAGFEHAIANAVENAIEHNRSPLTIDIETVCADDTVTIQITDNGDGISTAETDALDVGQETALTHGSGVGLWVMKLYTEKSDGRLDITGDETGTTVGMTLGRG